MDIKIPDSFDNEWQSEMLSKLLCKLNELYDGQLVLDDGAEILDDAFSIIEALREYSGD